jgi:hypothetical protein
MGVDVAVGEPGEGEGVTAEGSTWHAAVNARKREGQSRRKDENVIVCPGEREPVSVRGRISLWGSGGSVSMQLMRAGIVRLEGSACRQ